MEISSAKFKSLVVFDLSSASILLPQISASLLPVYSWMFIVKCDANSAYERYARNVFLSVQKSKAFQNLLMQRITLFRGREAGTAGLGGVCFNLIF